MREDVWIERVAAGGPIDGVPLPRGEGNVAIIAIVDEVAVMETRLSLREELRIVRGLDRLAAVRSVKATSTAPPRGATDCGKGVLTPLSSPLVGKG